MPQEGLLCLDIGNTHIYGGLFEGNVLRYPFRYASNHTCTSDEFGLFLKTYLRELQIEISISAVAYCTVVPSLEYTIHAAFIKYFSLTPFVLQPGIQTGLQVHYTYPQEIGNDRIANAIAAHHLFPHHDLIVIDLGSTTTCEIITQSGIFLGGVIFPGIKTQMESLSEKTAQLPTVRIQKPTEIVGKNTISNIQSGLYYGHRGALREIRDHVTEEVFQGRRPFVIGTGGFAHLFEQDDLFDTLVPDLVLQGLRIAYLNRAKNP